jgi:hypothetical protein
MRPWILLLGLGCADVPDDTDGVGPGSSTVLDLDGDYGPPPPPARFARAVHLRFDLGPTGLAFNDTGVAVARGVPPGGATPYLPLPVASVSLQLLSHDGEVARTPATSVPEGLGGLLVAFGTAADPRAVATTTDLQGVAGRVSARALHATPGLPYVGLVDLGGSPLPALMYGAQSDSFTFPAGATRRWALDLDADGVPDLLLAPFQLDDLDSAGRPQVVELFVIPTGQTLPGPVPLPIPALLVVPLDAPGGIFVVPPSAG